MTAHTLTAPTQQTGPNPSAFVDTLCKIHLDMHFPEWDDSILSAFDADKIVRTIAESGCQAMVVFAKDTYGNAYYDTKLGHRHRCIGKRDLLQEFLDAGRKHHVLMSAYFCAIWDNRCCTEHPEWQQRGADGEPMRDTVTNDGNPRWLSVCHNSGFAQVAEGMLEEIAQNYDVHAFHLDMFNLDFGGVSCYCDVCRQMFLEETGHDLPISLADGAVWRSFLEFRYRNVERYMRRLQTAIRKHKPGLPILMNYHGGPGFDWRTGQRPYQHAQFSDLGTIETYTPMLGTLYPGLGTRYVHSIEPTKPLEVVSWRMNRITDYTTKPIHQMRWELFTSMAFGANCMLIDQPFHDGTIDPYPYKMLRTVFAEAEKKRPYLGGVPEKHVGIYYSCKTRDLYGAENQCRFQQPVLGAYKAAVESHFSTGFLFDETVNAASLAAYPVVLLPNTAILSEVECKVLENYVRQGGTLIATHETSLYREDGRRGDDFALAHVFGVTYDGLHTSDAVFLRTNGDGLDDDLDVEHYVLTEGHVTTVQATTAVGVGALHDSFHKCLVPEQFFSHAMHPPHRRIGPMAYVNSFGAGKAIYFPAGVDAAYAGYHEGPEHRLLLRNAIRLAAHRPIVEVQAPLNVECAVLRKQGRILVHLLGFNGIHQSTVLPDLNRPLRPSLRMEEPPMYRASIRVNVPCKSVRSFNDHTELTWRGDRVEFIGKDVHEIIIVTPEK